MDGLETVATFGADRGLTRNVRALAMAVLVSLLALALLLGSQHAAALGQDQLCVTPTGAGGCYTTIGAALAAADPGDTILVATGVYTENVVISKTLVVQGGWNVDFTLRDSVDFSVTIRPADATQSVVSILAADPTFEGFVITGGRADLGSNHGGGMALRDSNAIVRDNVVISNSAFYLGGGVWVQRGAPIFEDNRIEGNLTLGLGQEAFGGGIQLENSNATLVRNLVLSNTIGSDGGYGGGLDVSSGAVTLTNNVLRGNGISGVGYGGGVALHLSATVHLDGDLIEGNHVDYGGGFYVDGAVLDLQNVTIAANRATRNIPGAGGGIYANGSSLTISNTTFRRNQTATGGGIYGLDGRLAISRSLVFSNSAVFDGGGIYNSGNAILSRVTVDGNAAGGDGGGIVNSGRLLIAGSVISRNVAGDNNGGGGALYLSGMDASARISNTLIVNNRAVGSTGSGGGILQSGGVISLTGVTVARNAASGGAGGGIANLDGGVLTIDRSTVFSNTAADGGGISQAGGAIALINATVSGNSAGNQGGGILNTNGAVYSGVMTFTNVTLVGNTAAAGDGLASPAQATVENSVIADNGTSNCQVPIFSAGHNLESTDTCGLGQAGDLVDMEPALGVIGDYGGPTPTHAVTSDSPAIDAGGPDGCPTVDQRGVMRPIDGNRDGVAVCDIGAVEYEPVFGVYLPLLMR